MSIDNEVLELLRKLLAKPEKKPGGGVGLEVDSIGPEQPHGVYVYDAARSKWVLKHVEGDYFKPWEDGVYVVYFDNTKCPACRVQDLYWYPFVKIFGSTFKSSHYIVILCGWFTRECDSSIAKGSFQYYDIHASPTILLMHVKDGSVKATSKLEGVKKIDELAGELAKFTEEAGLK